MELVKHALRGDPLNPIFHLTRSVHLNASGSYNEADVELRRALDLNPNLIFAYCWTIGQSLARGTEQQELARAEPSLRVGGRTESLPPTPA